MGHAGGGGSGRQNPDPNKGRIKQNFCGTQGQRPRSSPAWPRPNQSARYTKISSERGYRWKPLTQAHTMMRCAAAQQFCLLQGPRVNEPNLAIASDVASINTQGSAFGKQKSGRKERGRITSCIPNSSRYTIDHASVRGPSVARTGKEPSPTANRFVFLRPTVAQKGVSYPIDYGAEKGEGGGHAEDTIFSKLLRGRRSAARAPRFQREKRAIFLSDKRLKKKGRDVTHQPQVTGRLRLE